MLKTEKVDVWGFQHAIRGMRNPMNSWEKSDSQYVDYDICPKFFKVGTEHRKYLRQIMVSMDIIAPFYWWKEFDTYKVGTGIEISREALNTDEGKESPIAYDFVDNIGYLTKSYKKRCTTYRKNHCYFVEGEKTDGD